jgi:hypothetical protein
MARTRGRIRVVGLILILGVLAGCGGSGADKAGGASGQQPRILTMANPAGGSGELDGFVSEVARLSGGTIRIQVQNSWRAGQTRYETGLINKGVRDARCARTLTGTRP